MKHTKKNRSSKPILVLFGAVLSRVGLLALIPLFIAPLQKITAAKIGDSVQATILSSKVETRRYGGKTTTSVIKPPILFYPHRKRGCQLNFPHRDRIFYI